MKKRKKCDWIVGRSGCPDVEECKECVQKYYCKGYRYMRDNGKGEK